jgi:5-methylcytosine-specific restriction endonuclease McrA
VPRYIPQHVKTQVAVRDKGRCRDCGSKGSLAKPLQYHHKKEYAKGGLHTAANIILLCCLCHAKIHGYRKGALSLVDLPY